MCFQSLNLHLVLVNGSAKIIIFLFPEYNKPHYFNVLCLITLIQSFFSFWDYFYSLLVTLMFNQVIRSLHVSGYFSLSAGQYK